MGVTRLIPKIIHYCWFGKGGLPEQAQFCIGTWEVFCPGYKIILWDESNTDLEENTYIKQAYEAGKFAFVADYLRLKALYEYGGIYMDSDVELCNSLDEYLDQRAFVGCQEQTVLSTGLIAAEPHHPWIADLILHYENRPFINPNGKYETTPNTVFITELTTSKYNWAFFHKPTVLVDGLVVYPIDYFCCKDWVTGKIKKTRNTVAIHHFAGSWVDETGARRRKVKVRMIVRRLIVRIIGESNMSMLKKVRDSL